MKTQQHNYQVVPYPKLRRVLEIMYPSVQRKPMIHGLLEVDVTKAREFLRKHKAKTGESLSFTAFIITCLARAVDENKSLQAYHKGSKHLIVFDEVDVATAIEREMAGQKQAIVYIIRAANKKTFPEIHQEIRAAQVEKVEQAWEGLEASPLLQLLPMWLLKIGWGGFCWMRRAYPQVQKKYGGTVGVTAVGMFGKDAGWGIPINDHTIDITLGGIAEKPTVVNGQIAMRDYLCMTLSFNHAMIDGAPAARFAGRLKDLIESGHGLCESGAENVVSLPGEARRPAEREKAMKVLERAQAPGMAPIQKPAVPPQGIMAAINVIVRFLLRSPLHLIHRSGRTSLSRPPLLSPLDITTVSRCASMETQTSHNRHASPTASVMISCRLVISSYAG